MFVIRAHPPPPPPRPASVNLVLQHGGKPCKVSIALFVDYSYYSSTIRGLFVLFVDYSRTIRTIRRLFADYSHYSSTIRTIRTIRFTILVLSIAIPARETSRSLGSRLRRSPLAIRDRLVGKSRSKVILLSFFETVEILIK